MTENQNASPNEHPLFVSTTGAPILVALTNGKSAQVLVEPTPLHPMFHRAAVMKGAMPAGVAQSVHAEKIDVTELTREQVIEKAVREIISLGASDPSQIKSLFTNDGIPDVRAIESRVGFKVKSAERDAAWAAANEG